MFIESKNLQKLFETVAEDPEESSSDNHVDATSDGPKYGVVDESKMLEILNRMNRVVMILKVNTFLKMSAYPIHVR